jgi:hypothetical protein
VEGSRQINKYIVFQVVELVPGRKIRKAKGMAGNWECGCFKHASLKAFP